MTDTLRSAFAHHPMGLLISGLAALGTLNFLDAQAEEFAPVTTEMLENPDPSDWLMLGRTYDEQRFSPLDQVNQSNVNALRMAWTRGLPAGTESTIPIVYDGVLYVDGVEEFITANGLPEFKYHTLPLRKENLVERGDIPR